MSSGAPKAASKDRWVVRVENSFMDAAGARLLKRPVIAVAITGLLQLLLYMAMQPRGTWGPHAPAQYPNQHGFRTAILWLELIEGPEELDFVLGPAAGSSTEAIAGRALRTELAFGTKIDFAYALAYALHTVATVTLLIRLLRWDGWRRSATLARIPSRRSRASASNDADADDAAAAAAPPTPPEATPPSGTGSSSSSGGSAAGVADGDDAPDTPTDPAASEFPYGKRGVAVVLLLAYIAFLSEMFENCILLRVLDAEFDAATAPGTWLLPVLPLMARTKFASLFIACLLLGAAYARYFRPMTPPEDLLDLDASAVTGGKPGTRLVRTRRHLLGCVCDTIMLAGRADAVIPSLYFLAGGIGVVAVFGAPACNFLLEPAALLLGLAWNATWIHGLHLAHRVLALEPKKVE